MYVERITFRVALLVLALYATLFLAITSPAAPGRVIDFKEINTTHIRFANSYNDWQTAVDAYSTASPNFDETLRVAWLQYEVGENFRSLERALEGE